MADENKNEYAAQLQNFNGEQHKHFYVVIPQIYKVKFKYMKLILFYQSGKSYFLNVKLKFQTSLFLDLLVKIGDKKFFYDDCVEN